MRPQADHTEGDHAEADHTEADPLDGSHQLSPEPPAAAAGVVALAITLVAVPSLWRLVRPVSTLVHEAGHTIVALLAGRRVHAVKLFHRGGGCTTHSGAGSLGQVLTAAAGYTAPPLVGALLAMGLVHNVAAKLLLIAALPVVLVLLWFSRNPFGASVTLAVLAGAGLLLRYTAPRVQELVVLGLSAFLIAAGVRSTWELITLVRGGSRGNDAAMLARLTRLPALAWAVLFMLIAVGAAVSSGRMLLGGLVAS